MAEKTAADIPAGKVWQAQQAALMRLQLYLVGETHAMLREVLAGCRKALDEARGDATEWDGMSIHLATEGCLKAWSAGYAGWKELFATLRWGAALIPLGTLAVLHRAAFGPRRARSAQAPMSEATTPSMPTPVFKPQPQVLLDVKTAMDAGAARVYADGHDLSDRIWRLDQVTMDGIRQTIVEGVANGDSAWRLAQRLEQSLGAGAGCPRWTRTRLYELTKSDIASGDRTGLYAGDECDSQGVAYSALRLARNEIQVAHHLATDTILAGIPWIEKEQVHLSPAHPEDDICDDVISNGENGEGIYQKGEIQLPLHPQCLCYKSGLLQSPDEFAGKLRGWLNGTGAWPEMDEYAGWLGADADGMQDALLGAIGQRVAQNLVTWLWGGQDAMDDVVKRYVLPGGQLAFPDF